MKKIIILISLFICISSLTAQQNKYETNFSPVVKIGALEKVREILGEADEEIYLIKSIQKPFTALERFKVEAYSSKMQLKREIELKLQYEDINYEKCLMHKGMFYVFFSRNESKNLVLYFASFDLKGKNISKTFKLTSMKYVYFKDRERFPISFTPDSSGFLIGTQPESDDKTNSSSKFIFMGLDGRILNTVDIDYGTSVKNIIQVNYHIDKKDNVYILVKNKSEEKVKGKSKYEYKVFRYIESKNSIEEYNIDIDKNYISGIKMSMNSKGDFFCTGFYSDEKEHYMKGIFYLELNPDNNSIVNLNYKDFENKLIKEYSSDKGAHHKGDFSNFQIIDILEKPSGGYYFIAEHQVVKTGDGSASFAYRHIILAQLSESGIVEQVSLIPKRQLTIKDDGYYSSFTYGMKGESLFLIFNDNKKNSTEVKPVKLNQMFPSSGVLVIVEIKQNGKMSKTPLFKTKIDNTIIAPRFGKILDSGLVVNHSLYERKFRMIGIQL